MMRSEATERTEMQSLRTQLTELQNRLRYLEQRAEHWHQWQQTLADEYVLDDDNTYGESDDATQPETEPPERGR